VDCEIADQRVYRSSGRNTKRDIGHSKPPFKTNAGNWFVNVWNCPVLSA
jgi:hypothetical protein